MEQNFRNLPETPLPRRNVCLFGTSANPPTGDRGHVGIVRALSDWKRPAHDDPPMYDEIRVVPVYSHPFPSKHRQLADYDHRRNMCRLAFRGIDRVTVDESERTIHLRKQEGAADGDAIRVGTADLLDHYRSIDPPTCQYALCLGADTFLDLMGGKWRRTEEILNGIQGRFVVLYRKQVAGNDDDLEAEELSLETKLQRAVAQLEEIYGRDTVQLLQIPSLGAVSSTLVRSLSSELSLPSLDSNKSGEEGESEFIRQQQRTEERLEEMVDDKVLEYMKEHQLYGIGEQVVVNA